MKAIQTIDHSEYIEISGVDFSKVCTIDSNGPYRPSTSAVALISGYVDRAGNLYYQTKAGILKKRTINMANDNKKLYRLCIGGEKFSLSVHIDKVNEVFRLRDLKGVDTGNTTYGLFVFEGNDVVELQQGFKTHKEAETALFEALKDWDNTYYHGIVFSTNGKIMKTKMEVSYE